MKKKLPRAGVTLAICLFCSWANSQVILNEYSCSNLKSYPDNFEKFEDWIELYNSGDNPVDISGYHLSDKASKPTKWMIPVSQNAVIPAKGFLLIWASQRDTVVGTYFHTNFGLKQTSEKKEVLIFADPSGNVIDSCSLSIAYLSHSLGRISDGGSEWGIYGIPTPGESNNTSTVITYTDKPSFGTAPGFYSTSIDVAISANLNPGDTIRYTVDGTAPTDSSAVYSAPVSIESTTVLKAKVFSSEDTLLPGQMEYGTYFINEDHSLVVISISADSLQDLANDFGGQAWDTTSWDTPSLAELVRPHGTFEYYGKDKMLKSKSMGELNKHGKDSWICDQRALDFIARDEMGDNHAIQEKIFSYSDRKSFQRLILRASGDDNYPCGHNVDNIGSAHMRDGYIHNLVKRSDLRLDVRFAERVIVYINGEYWGVYEVREKPVDHDFTKYYYDQDKYDIQYLATWGETWAEYGDAKALNDWRKLKNFILANDMSVAENYERVESELNVKSLVDYVMVNSFTVCSDWLNYNVGWWRGLDPDGDHKKWGYILWDNDATFGFYINYTGIPDVSANAKPCNPETLTNPGIDLNGHIRILKKLMANEEFHNYYVNRYIDLMNTTFSCDSMLNYLDEYKAIIEPEMERHAARWDGTYAEWNSNVAQLRRFIEERCTAVQSGMNSCYDLNGPYSLTLTDKPLNSGSIKMNSITIDTLPWHGIAYDGIQTRLKVKSKTESDIFYGWSASTSFIPHYADKEVFVNISGEDVITANFERFAPNDLPANEISSLIVYPTLTTGLINITSAMDQALVNRVEIFDYLGRKLYDESFYGATEKTIQIDLSDSSIKNGSYLIQVSTAVYKKTAKFVLLR